MIASVSASGVMPWLSSRRDAREAGAPCPARPAPRRSAATASSGRAEIIDFAPGELARVPDYAPSPELTRLSRGAVSIEVEPTAGVRVRIVTTHLKSKLISYP